MDIIFKIKPVPAPRMSQRDRFAPSKQAKKYFSYCNTLRAMAASNKYRITLPLSITFVVAMPASWSKTKKERINGEDRKSRPDLDNYIKGFKDALASEDAWVSRYGSMAKIHGYESKIIVHVKED